MRLLVHVLLFVFLSFSVIAGEVDKATKKEFVKVYKAFQQAEKDGDHEAKLSMAKQAYELGRTVYADKPETLLILANNYGLLIQHLKKSIPSLTHAAELTKQVYGPDSNEYVFSLLTLAEARLTKNY